MRSVSITTIRCGKPRTEAQSSGLGVEAAISGRAQLDLVGLQIDAEVLPEL